MLDAYGTQQHSKSACAAGVEINPETIDISCVAVSAHVAENGARPDAFSTESIRASAVEFASSSNFDAPAVEGRVDAAANFETFSEGTRAADSSVPHDPVLDVPPGQNHVSERLHQARRRAADLEHLFDCFEETCRAFRAKLRTASLSWRDVVTRELEVAGSSASGLRGHEPTSAAVLCEFADCWPSCRCLLIHHLMCCLPDCAVFGKIMVKLLQSRSEDWSLDAMREFLSRLHIAMSDSFELACRKLEHRIACVLVHALCCCVGSAACVALLCWLVGSDCAWFGHPAADGGVVQNAGNFFRDVFLFFLVRRWLSVGVETTAQQQHLTCNEIALAPRVLLHGKTTNGPFRCVPHCMCHVWLCFDSPESCGGQLPHVQHATKLVPSWRDCLRGVSFNNMWHERTFVLA